MFTLTNLIQKYKKKEFLHIDKFSFPDKGLVLIKGPNGSGKTTLLKTILGLLPYSGTIKFLNKNIDEWGNSLFEKVCYVPQFNTLFNNLNLEENLRLNNIFLNQPDQKYPKTNKIKKLSGGQQKKANLDRGVFFDFLCYILDEPTTSLDLTRKQELCEFIQKEKEKKLFICVSHDEFLDSYADKIVQMDRFLMNENEVKNTYENNNVTCYKNTIPFKFYFNLFLEEKLITFFKLASLTILCIIFFLIYNIYTLSKDEMEKTYITHILNYAYVEKDKEIKENVYEEYIQYTSGFDMVGCSGSRNVIFYKNENGILRKVENIYFSKSITNAIISDYVLEEHEDVFSWSILIENEIVEIDKIEMTRKALFVSNSGNKLDACSYIILPYKILESYSEDFKNQLHFTIKSTDELPLDYKYIQNYSDYSELKESYFLPRILLIPAAIIIFAIFIYIELVQFHQRKNSSHFDEKLKVFAAPPNTLLKVQLIKEAVLIFLSFVLSMGIGILFVYLWVSNHTTSELRNISILSARIPYEYLGISLFLLMILFGLQALIIRRKI